MKTIALLLAAFLAWTGAFGQSPAKEVTSIDIDYSGLDISKRADVIVLYERIQHAAIAVCPSYAPRDVRRYEAWHDCYVKAVDNAVERVNSPLLTAIHMRNEWRKEGHGLSSD